MKLMRVIVIFALWSCANVATAQQQPQVPPEVIKRARVLDEVLLTHPKEEVRQTLRYWIRNDQVWLSFDLHSGAGVMMAPIRNPKGGELRPTLILNAEWLTSAPLQEKQVAIWKMWTYVNQFYSGRYPASIFYPIIVLPGGIAPPNDVPLYFWKEAEAVEAECELAKELGLTTYNPPMCGPYNERGARGLREAYAATMAQEPAFAPYREVLGGLAHSQPPTQKGREHDGKGNGRKGLLPPGRRGDI